MKTSLRTLTLAMATLAFRAALAGEAQGPVEAMYVTEGGIIHFAIGPIGNVAGCGAANPWDWSFSLGQPGGRAMYAALLAAMLTDRSVVVGGANACVATPDKETAAYIEYLR